MRRFYQAEVRAVACPTPIIAAKPEAELEEDPKLYLCEPCADVMWWNSCKCVNNGKDNCKYSWEEEWSLTYFC